MNTQWHFLQRCWASGKMLSILRLLILKASFPDLMELCDKRVREIGHRNNLLRKEGRSSSILHEINKGFTLFSTWEPPVDQSKPTFWGGVGPSPCSHSIRGSMLVEPLLQWTSSLPCRPRARTLIRLYIPSTIHSVCSTPVSWMNACILYETSPLNSYVRKPIHFLSKQNWARKISEQASQAGMLSRVEATVCVNRSTVMITTNNS